MLAATALAAALMAGLFTKPGAAPPEVTKSAAEAEAQRQMDYLVASRAAEEDRVNGIGYRLLLANAELCPKTRSRLGLSFGVAEDYHGPTQAAAVRRWSLGDTVRLTWVAPGGAAQLAGLRVGDEIVTLQGAPVPTGKRATGEVTKLLDAALSTRPESVTIGIRRGGEALDVQVRPQILCAYDVVLDKDSNELNAYADGARITVTRPMLKLASSDDELALVLGHELAHDARRHMAAQGHNARVGLFGGALLDVAAAAAGVDTQGAFMKAGQKIGREAYSADFESEADYVGLYFMARAGFSIEHVEDFWRRAAAEGLGSVLQRSSHPPNAERFLAIAATREEIQAKGGDASKLTPNEQPKAPPAAAN